MPDSQARQSDSGHIAIFEVTVYAVDKPSSRRRWNGEPLASEEANQALDSAVEAIRAALRERGFEVLRSGYGVRAIEGGPDA